MNIWNTIIVKISHVVSAVLIFVGLSAPATIPPVTIVDIEPTGAVSVQQLEQTSPFVTGLPQIAVKPTQQAPKPTQITPESIQVTPEPVQPGQQQTIYVPVYVLPQPELAPAPVTPAPTQTMPKEEKIEEKVEEKQAELTLELFAPVPEKWVEGRKYLAEINEKPELMDEYNYVDMGLYIKEGNNYLGNVLCSVKATDDSQSKELNGTGNVRKIYINQSAKTVPYYSFHYEFKTVGTHEITFTCQGKSVSVTFDVTLDTRQVSKVKQ